VSPPTSSYPSGHTAAATVLYISLAVITAYALARADQARRFTGWLVSVAALIILFVAVSRLYRGMHHPTDVVAGFLLGLGALLVTTMAVKAWRGDSS
jgi:undecaprenyl-diphosphatase